MYQSDEKRVGDKKVERVTVQRCSSVMNTRRDAEEKENNGLRAFWVNGGGEG